MICNFMNFTGLFLNVNPTLPSLYKCPPHSVAKQDSDPRQPDLRMSPPNDATY